MPDYAPGAEVDILIWQKTDLGFKAIIDNKYSGLLYENEIFRALETGMQMKAFVKQVREDGKVDLILQKPGFEKSMISRRHCWSIFGNMADGSI